MDITTLVDEFVEENYGEVSNDDLAYHFYQLGLKDAKEQMMKDAIDAKVLPANLEETMFCLDDINEVERITKMVKENNLKIGDEVKLIIIKED